MHIYEILFYAVIGGITIITGIIVDRRLNKAKRAYKKQYQAQVERIQHTWEKVTVPAECIDVLNADTTIHKEEYRRGEDPIEHITRTRIYLYPVIDGEKQEFVKIIDKDHTVIGFKIRAKGAVDIYFSYDDNPDFYIDLVFLEEEIQFNQS